MAGNARLYRSLLGQFARSQAGFGGEIRTALASGDLSAAERLAHSLKGVAGNLGAGSINGLAGELEKALRAGDEPAATVVLDRLAPELATMVSAIGEALADAPAAAASPAGERPDVSPHLDRLASLLANDDGEALDVLLEVRDSLAAAIDAPDLDDLQEQVGNFDFAAALERLKQIRDRLEGQS